MIVVRKLEIVYLVIVFPEIYTACHTDDNGNKPGSNLIITDKRVAGRT